MSNEIKWDDLIFGEPDEGTQHYYLLDDGDIAALSSFEQYDEEAPSPRDYGHDSTFVTFSRNYSSPDETDFSHFDDMLKHFGVKWNEYEERNMREDLDQLMEKALKKGYVLLPVWKYEHGGLSYSASEHYPFHDSKPSSSAPGWEGGWDGGLCGAIYEKRNRRNVEQVKDQLKSEVEEYSAWANGETMETVYKYQKFDRDGDEITEGTCYDPYDVISDLYASPVKYLGEFENIEECLDEKGREIETFEKTNKSNDKER